MSTLTHATFQETLGPSKGLLDAKWKNVGNEKSMEAKGPKEKEETEKETEEAQTLEYGQHGFGWKGFRIMSRRAHLFRHL